MRFYDSLKATTKMPSPVPITEENHDTPGLLGIDRFASDRAELAVPRLDSEEAGCSCPGVSRPRRTAVDQVKKAD